MARMHQIRFRLGLLPQTLLRELTALPRPPIWILDLRVPTSKGRWTGREKGVEQRERCEEEGKGGRRLHHGFGGWTPQRNAATKCVERACSAANCDCPEPRWQSLQGSPRLPLWLVLRGSAGRGRKTEKGKERKEKGRRRSERERSWNRAVDHLRPTMIICKL